MILWCLKEEIFLDDCSCKDASLWSMMKNQDVKVVSYEAFHIQVKQTCILNFWLISSDLLLA